MIEAAEFKKLAAVEGAGSAAAVEAGEEIGDAVVDAVSDAQRAILPPALREAGLLTLSGGIAEENLAGDGEDGGVGEAIEERLQEAEIDAHVAVEEHDDV